MHRDAALRVFHARSDALRRIHFRLRYQVYCVENEYEPREAYPDGLEVDEHDARAEHFLVRAGAMSAPGAWVGTMRLIPTAADPETDPRPDTLEVSRLIACDPRHRGTSRVLYYLCHAAQAYAVDHGYAALTFLVRPALARLLGRQGLPLERYGDPLQHRGLRVPYRIDAEAARSGLEQWRAKLQLPAAASEELYTPLYGVPPERAPTFTCKAGPGIPQLQNT